MPDTPSQVHRSWAERQADLAQVAASQLFFVGGAPRSGTTWLQQMLDSHPLVSCAGEGVFLHQLAEPLDRLVAERAAVLDRKNQHIFRHTGGYRLPTAEDTDLLLGTAMLAALHRQAAGKPYRAIGEKTPENIFAFTRFRRLFPAARLIGIVRDPRDVLASAWHFFQKVPPGEDEAVAKRRFVEGSLPSMRLGTQVLLDHVAADPEHCMLVVYERLLTDPDAELARVFGFLGVPNDAGLVAGCVERTRFDRVAGARKPGEVRNGAFHRSGSAGGWRDTFGPDINERVLQQLGWTSQRCGWTP